MKKLYILLTAILLWPVVTIAQNAETCGTATTAVDGTNTVADLTGTGGSSGGAAAWFTYTPAEGGTINIETCLQGVDTEFEVFDGDCATLNEIASGGDNCATGNGNNYAAAVYDVSVVGGTTYYIEFHDQYSTTGFDFEFSFVPTPTCDDISGLTVTGFTDVSASFDWNDDGNTSWEYAVGPEGFDVDAATYTTTSNDTAEVSGLSAGTFYDFYVRTDCGSEFGAWEMVTFRTMGVGDNCAMPIVVDLDADLPYSDLDQFTCGRGVPYSSSCLGSYDGGESIVYQLDLASTMTVKIEMDPNGTTWSGLGLFDACPDVGECIDIQTGSSSDPRIIIAELDAGTYFVMASTYPSPNCIPVLDLTISQVLCSDVTGLGTTSISETEISFNWNVDGNTSWDYVVDVEGFDVDLATPTNVTDTFATAMSLVSDQFYDVYVRTNCGSDVGDWAMITVKTVGAGDNCDVPIMIDLSATMSYADSNQTTCGRVDDYDQTCMGFYDGGEDIIYELVLDAAMDIELILDPDGTTYYGVGIFDACPGADNCIETVTESGSSISTITTQLAAGTYYIMVDTWPSPDCIPNFHITITGTEVSCTNVTDVTTTDVTADGVTVSWNSDGNTSWQYAYGETGFDIDTTDLITVTDTFVVITGLSQGVIYDYYIRTDCGLTTSEWTINTGALPPPNNQVCNATEITVNGDAEEVDNTWATYSDVSGSCWGGTIGNPDVWLMFDFTPTAAENGVEITTLAGTSDDSRIALYTVTGCPDGPVEFTELACSEDISSTDYMSFIDGVALDAGTYYIQCGSWSGTEGSYSVQVNSVYVSDTCSTFLGGPWGDFNTAFGGAPVDSAGICPFNEITAFEVYASEVYTVDNFMSGETYTFSICNGSYGAWVPELSVWDEDGNIVAFNQDTCAISWTATYDGTYLIGINEVDACGSASDNTSTSNGYPALTCNGSVAVNEIERADFAIYPNPNNGVFNIVNEGQAGNYIIEVMDIAGKVVYAEQLQLNGNAQTEINTSGINTGVYLVKMTNTKDNYHRTMRMVIK